MKIKVTQCQVGRFNLMSNEKSLSFYMAIQTMDGKTYEEDGIKAVLHYSGDENELHDFEDAINNLEYVWEKCYRDSDKVISSTPYRDQCLLFLRTYKANYELIDLNMLSDHCARIEKEIAKLQKELAWNTIIPEIDVTHVFANEIKEHERTIAYWEKELLSIKEGTEKYETTCKTIEKYRSKIKQLNDITKSPVFNN